MNLEEIIGWEEKASINKTRHYFETENKSLCGKTNITSLQKRVDKKFKGNRFNNDCNLCIKKLKQKINL